MKDSRIETFYHIREVQKNMQLVIEDLQRRALNHDYVKLIPPEVDYFNEVSGSLGNCEYGSEEYEKYLKKLEVALQHHYSLCDHHPQFWSKGFAGMHFLALIELICDWMAAVKRHKQGCIYKSIEINQERFGYPDYVKEQLIETTKYIENLKEKNTIKEEREVVNEFANCEK